MKFKPSKIETIKTQIKLHLRHDDYNTVDSLLSNAYLLEENGEEYICINDTGGDGTGGMCMMFSTVNGTFYDTIPWEYAKQNGTFISLG